VGSGCFAQKNKARERREVQRSSWPTQEYAPSSRHFRPSDYRNGIQNVGLLNPGAVSVLELKLTVKSEESLGGTGSLGDTKYNIS
jgi:hypothetical protein